MHGLDVFLYSRGLNELTTNSPQTALESDFYDNCS